MTIEFRNRNMLYILIFKKILQYILILCAGSSIPARAKAEQAAEAEAAVPVPCLSGQVPVNCFDQDGDDSNNEGGDDDDDDDDNTVDDNFELTLQGTGLLPMAAPWGGPLLCSPNATPTFL